MVASAQILILEKNDTVTRILEELLNTRQIYGLDCEMKILEFEGRAVIARELRLGEYKVLFELTHKYEQTWFVDDKNGSVFVFFVDKTESGLSTIIRLNGTTAKAVITSSEGRIITLVKDQMYLICEEQMKVLRIEDNRLFRLDASINFVHMVTPNLFVVRYKLLNNDYAVGALEITKEVQSRWLYKAGQYETIAFTRLVKEYVAVLIKQTTKDEISSEGKLIFIDPRTGKIVHGILEVKWMTEVDLSDDYVIQTTLGKFILHSDFSLERIY